MGRPISFEHAKARYVHRYTMEHVPEWTQTPFGDGKFPAPQFRTDREWYDATKFHGEDPLADERHCYTSGQTWPLGKTLKEPYRLSRA